MNDHLGDLAALHALGALDERERARADAHLERCDACRRLLAQAESDVTAMAAAQPQLEPPPELARRVLRQAPDDAGSPRRARASWPAAIAAAIAIALLPSAYLWQQNRSMHAVMVADSDLMARLASSPHRTASFAGSGPSASVMYGTDGTWYAVIVRNATGPLRLVWPHDRQETELGTLTPRGAVAVLYLPRSHPMRRLVLMNGEEIVSQAQLAF
jgi:anti-sigma factor RsiW